MTETPPRTLGTTLVTGATGQVGRRLVARLLADGQAVAVLTRRPEAVAELWPRAGVLVRAGDLADATTLHSQLEGIDTLFHLASYAPGPDEPDLYNAPHHWTVTAEGTGHLAALARRSDVKRIVYLSTIKALGDRAGAMGFPASETTEPRPDTLYGRAKLEAERQVLDLGVETDIEASVVRLPMVYGIGDKGNIPRMIHAVAARRFPPWPRRENHRCAVHVDDVVEAAILVASSPKSAGQTYCVTDGHAYSTRWLYEQILTALSRPIPRWSVPVWVLRLGASAGTLAERLLRRRMPLTLDGLDKLLGDAWYASDKLERELGFTPKRSLAEEIPRLTRSMTASPCRAPEQPHGRSTDSG